MCVPPPPLQKNAKVTKKEETSACFGFNTSPSASKSSPPQTPKTTKIWQECCALRKVSKRTLNVDLAIFYKCCLCKPPLPEGSNSDFMGLFCFPHPASKIYPMSYSLHKFLIKHFVVSSPKLNLLRFAHSTKLSPNNLPQKNLFAISEKPSEFGL